MKPNTERLMMLANHLLTGKMGHSEFDFTRYNNAVGPHCGTAGCALGECPIIWPDEWRFNKRGEPTMKKFGETPISAQVFFSIDDDQDDHLFYPAMQNVEIYGGAMLNHIATKEQVANNIIEFCKKYQ